MCFPDKKKKKHKHDWASVITTGPSLLRSVETEAKAPYQSWRASLTRGCASAALLPNKSPAAAAGSLLFSNLDRSVWSKSWLSRSAPPPHSRGEQGPLCQRSLWCQASLANPKQKPEYAAESLTPRWMMGLDVEYSKISTVTKTQFKIYDGHDSCIIYAVSC